MFPLRPHIPVHNLEKPDTLEGPLKTALVGALRGPHRLVGAVRAMPVPGTGESAPVAEPAAPHGARFAVGDRVECRVPVLESFTARYNNRAALSGDYRYPEIAEVISVGWAGGRVLEVHPTELASLVRLDVKPVRGPKIQKVSWDEMRMAEKP